MTRSNWISALALTSSALCAYGSGLYESLKLEPNESGGHDLIVAADIATNIWTGSGDFLAPANWFENPQDTEASALLPLYGPFPKATRDTFIGPFRDDNQPRIIFPRVIGAAGPALLSGPFSTPGLDMRAGPNTALTLNPGANLSSPKANIGTTGTDPQTQAGWKAVLNLNGGTITGSWTFTDRAEVNVLSSFSQPAGVWNGTPGKFTTAQGATFTVANLLTLANEVSNAGTIKLTGDNTAGNSELRTLGPVSLTGGGEIVLTNTTRSFIDYANNLPSGGLTNIDNTIRGQGTVNAMLTNRSIVRAEGGLLNLPRATFDNGQGRLEVASNGVLALTGADGNLPLGDVSIEQGGRIFSGSVLQDVNLIGPGDLLVYSGTTIVLQGTTENPGNIVINGGTGSSNSLLKISGAVSLTGGGEVLLTNAQRSHITYPPGEASSSVLTNVDHTIRGQGTIDVKLINRSVVRAEGGWLSLSRNNFDNSQGRLEVAANGVLLLGGPDANLPVGDLAIEPGGQLAFGTVLQDANLLGPGDLVVPANSYFYLRGATTNASRIVVNGTSSNAKSARLIIAGKTSLAGGGELLLTHPSRSVLEPVDSTSVLTNVDHVIRGQGTVSVNLLNRSIVRAEGGLLSLSLATFDNTQGRLEIAADGTLGITGTDSDLPVGDLAIEAGGRIASGTILQDVNLLGPGDLLVPSGVNVTLQGSATNPGTIVVSADGSTGSSSLRISGPVNLSGGGEILLGHATRSRLEGTSPVSVLTNVDHTIHGHGMVSVNLLNQAVFRAEGGPINVSSSSFRQTETGVTDIKSELVMSNYAPQGGSLVGTGILRGSTNLADTLVSPGPGLATLSIEGACAMAASSRQRVELGGMMPAASRPLFHDVLIVHGDVTLGGILDVSVAGPIPNSASFVVLTTRDLNETSSLSHLHPFTGLPVLHPQLTGTPKGLVSGNYLNLDSAGRISTSDGQGSFLVTITAESVILSDFQLRLSQHLVLSDDDGDGTLFIYEWLFGGDPDHADSGRQLVQSGTINGAELSAIAQPRSFATDQNFPTYSFRIRKKRQDVGVHAEVTKNLDFAAGGPLIALQVSRRDDDGDFEVITYAIVHETENNPPPLGFIRLAIDLSQLPAF